MSNRNDNKKKGVKERIEPETPEELFYSWALDRQLTWGVIILACLTGLIELLPSLSTNNRSYFASLSMIYFGLSFGLSYSINYLGKLFRVSYNILEPMFSQRKIGKYLEALVGKHQPYLLKSWVTTSGSVALFVVWCIVWISKAGLLG